MNPNSVNPLAEGEKQVSVQEEDVATGVKNPDISSTNGHAKTRRDEGATHFNRYGLLSRDIVRALVRSGESLRSIRRYEKKFRAVFKPRGTLGELIFDRAWSSYLRLQLLAKLEARVLTSDHPNRRPHILSELREGNLPTLVTESDLNEFEIAQTFDTDISEGLFRELALAQRYDSHYAREATRMFGLLLVMRRGGKAALEKFMVDGLDFTKLPREGK
jgi:hypothetical protein